MEWFGILSVVRALVGFVVSRRADRRAEERHAELLRKIEEISSKLTAEPRGTVREARNVPLTVKFAESIAASESFSAVLIHNNPGD